MQNYRETLIIDIINDTKELIVGTPTIIEMDKGDKISKLIREDFLNEFKSYLEDETISHNFFPVSTLAFRITYLKDYNEEYYLRSTTISAMGVREFSEYLTEFI